MNHVQELKELVEFRSDVCGTHSFLEMTTQDADGTTRYAARVVFSSPSVRAYDSIGYHATFADAKNDAALVALVALRRRFRIAASGEPIKSLKPHSQGALKK